MKVKSFFLTSLMMLMFSFAFSQGWNNAVTTTLTDNQVISTDNFANKDGIHVLTIGDYIRYNLLNSSGSIVRSFLLISSNTYNAVFRGARMSDTTFRRLYLFNNPIPKNNFVTDRKNLRKVSCFSADFVRMLFLQNRTTPHWIFTEREYYTL